MNRFLFPKIKSKTELLALQVLTALAIFTACEPKFSTRLLTAVPVQNASEELATRTVKTKPGEGQLCCNDVASYAPDSAQTFPIRYVRVNVHFMNTTDSLHNFNEEEGARYAKDLIHHANNKLRQNEKMRLPPGNDTPVLPVGILFQLAPHPGDPADDGVYFHYDDELTYFVDKGKHANNYKKDAINKYGVRLDEVLNIFLVPHHPDSVASKTYRAHGTGIALGNAMKLAGQFELKIPSWGIVITLNHEMGHIFGLAHSWTGNDGCDDTPKHRNCWSPSSPNCTDSTASNNVMDYNAYQSAWTPCQLGKVHLAMSKEKSAARKMVSPRWCELDSAASLVVRDSVHWKGAKDLQGNLTIEPGGRLKISCRVSLPTGAKITVQPGGKLYLDNCRLHQACDGVWHGIEIQELGKVKGAVIFLGAPVLENLAAPTEGGDSREGK